MIACDSLAKVTFTPVKGLLPTFLMVKVNAVLPAVSLIRLIDWIFSWPVALSVLVVLKKIL